MASHKEIKDAILAVAGNPESGIVFEMASEFADAIVGLEASLEGPTKETRVTKPEEKR